ETRLRQDLRRHPFRESFTRRALQSGDGAYRRTRGRLRVRGHQHTKDDRTRLQNDGETRRLYDRRRLTGWGADFLESQRIYDDGKAPAGVLLWLDPSAD